TLRALAETQRLDVWYLFPLRDVTRQLALRIEGVGPKAAKLDRVLGREWRELYEVDSTQIPLFGPIGAERQVTKPEIEAWFKSRLESCFAFVSNPLPILGARAVHTFSLFLCVSNPSRAAITLASQFMRYVNRPFDPGAFGRT